MAKKEETSTANEGIKADDAIFMAECLKHLQTPANIDVKGVATALKYKNSASVANRIRALKKKFDLKVGCTAAAAAAAAGADGSPAAAGISPRKGAAANRGPTKATGASDETDDTESKAGSGAGAKKTRTPRKRAAKSSMKVEDSDEDAAVKTEEEP